MRGCDEDRERKMNLWTSTAFDMDFELDFSLLDMLRAR